MIDAGPAESAPGITPDELVPCVLAEAPDVCVLPGELVPVVTPIDPEDPAARGAGTGGRRLPGR
jgi:hypothetical protein